MGLGEPNFCKICKIQTKILWEKSSRPVLCTQVWSPGAQAPSQPAMAEALLGRTQVDRIRVIGDRTRDGTKRVLRQSMLGTRREILPGMAAAGKKGLMTFFGGRGAGWDSKRKETLKTQVALKLIG